MARTDTPLNRIVPLIGLAGIFSMTTSHLNQPIDRVLTGSLNDDVLWVNPVWAHLGVAERAFAQWLHPDDRALWLHLRAQPDAAPLVLRLSAPEKTWLALECWLRPARPAATASPGEAWSLWARPYLAPQKNAQAFQAMVETTLVGLYRQDAQGYCVYVNPAWCRLSGLSVEESLGLGWQRAVHPDDLARAMGMWNGKLADPEAHALEYRLIHRDGTVVWVLDHTRPEYDLHGHLLGYVGTVTDITSLKTAANTLHQTEAYLRGLLNALPDLVFYINDNGIFADAYIPAAFQAGVTAADYVGRHVTDVLPPLAANRVLRALHLAALSCETQVLEYSVGREAVTLEARVSPAAAGHHLLMVRNITPRKQAENALAQRTAYLDALAESTRAILHALDRDSVLAVVLESASRILNTPHIYISVRVNENDIESLAGSGIFAPYVGRRFSAAGGLAGKVLETGVAACVNDYANWSDRLEPLYHHAPIRAGAAVPLHPNGRFDGVLAAAYLEPNRTFDDDALEIMRRFAELASLALEKSELYHNVQQQRDALQAALARADAFAQATEAANRAKSEFLTTTSHEMRNPLHVIQAWSRELAAQTSASTDRTLAQRIAAESAWLLTFTEDLLDQAKIEAGRFNLQISDFDIRAVVDDVLTVQRWRAQMGVALQAQVADAVPSHIMADARRVRQVLLNLVSNAAKHTRHGTVTVAVTVAQAAPCVLRFAVQDTGVGLSEADLARLFKPFGNLPQEASSLRTESHGLGLVISEQLVQHMGGHMGVTSQVGQGSTFWFTLPVEPVDTLPAMPSLPASARILLVDDQPTNTAVLQAQLQALGHTQVMMAHTASEAIHHFETGQGFEVILLDMNLPDMHGADLAHAVRLWEHFHSLPRARLVAVTAAEWEANLATHFDVWLPKPFTVEQLAHALAQPAASRPSPTAVRQLPEYAALLEVFMDTGGALMQQLHASVQANALPAMRQQAHALRGAALNMGSNTLAYWAACLERATNPALALQLWPNLQAAWQAVHAELDG